jgi:heme-degrading monooxygenase HmoA
MFIAMNRLKVIKEECKAFEDAWLTRDSRLGEVKGFVAFHLLRGPEREDHVLYSSHTIWATKEDFSAWTKSGQFRAAHHQADEHKPLTFGHPEFEGFESSSRLKIRIRPGSRLSTRCNSFAASRETTIAGARQWAPWLAGLLRPCPNGS